MRIRKQGPVDDVLKEEDFLTAAKVADALAHPVRIRMLRFILAENLARRTVSNKDLVREFDYAQATISQHMSKLITGGLIEVKKKGTSSYYFAKVGKLSVFAETLKKIEGPANTNEMPEFLKGGVEETVSEAEAPADESGDGSDVPEFLRAGFYDADDIVAELSGYPDSEYQDEEGEGSDTADYDDAPRFL